ncbi:hypothetical protein CK501_02865 [Halovibrio salipaludis]|uniref:Mut7-C RNAse domain-containing protein n=2 Tax=Halovibrio salipaludis TaxID=2032626 RepID=A0A2A2F9J1_9GAMM|nr:hypothetical protein CK501_02865 [Halovibrio salipaludis]
MLNGIAQWLRVAGYDTAVPTPGLSDDQLMDQACTEGRWLVTADSDLLAFAEASRYVIYLQGGDDEARLRELTLRLDLDWCRAPFTLCRNCNTPLHEASGWEVAHYYPESVCLDGQSVWACSVCRQLFWEGSHVRRMRAQLETMNRWRQQSR